MPDAPSRDLTERDQPALFALLRSVALGAGADLPPRLELLAGVCARLAPGALGIGVGLLSVQTVSELRAAVAHELGHGFRPAGAAAQVLRVLRGLSEHLDHRRELRGAEAAIRAAGREVHLAALQAARRGEAHFETFVRDEVVPILHCGRHPDNVYDGFRAYLAELSEAREDGGLPPLPDDPGLLGFPSRVEHARAVPERGGPGGPLMPQDGRPARSLLANAERVERQLSTSLAATLAPGARLAPVGWLDVVETVWAPRLREEGRLLTARLSSQHGCAPTLRGALAALVRELEAGSDEPLARAVEPALSGLPDLPRGATAHGPLARALGVLLGCALLERGWRWRGEVGRALEVTRGPSSLAPFVEAREALQDRTRLPRLLDHAGAAA